MTTETRPLSTESAPIQPHQTEDGADSSPSAVREAEAQLILRHTHLKEGLARRQQMAIEFAAALRADKTEMAEIERLLRAHKRLREPIRRKK
jgi:hypothetical protein